jgi:shikimate 5-dehydrogenase
LLKIASHILSINSIIFTGPQPIFYLLYIFVTKMSLKGKVAVVTGASRGIGRGIALQLGEAGAKVYITGRDPKNKKSDPTLPSLEKTAQGMVSYHINFAQ